ncbi:MAG: hypothetical protein WCE69_14480 [Aestuariivirga sp.]
MALALYPDIDEPLQAFMAKCKEVLPLARRRTSLYSSLTVTALVPAFIFVTLVQEHLVSGLTMRLCK